MHMPHLPQNIVLTGFSGTGKTTVGRRVAEVLGRRFVDLDDVIARRAGKSITDIFVQDGEPAFRALEAVVCCELSEPQGLVVATGGGATVSAANRNALGAGGVLICLTATVDTILDRLAHHSDRPLLAGDDRADRVTALYAERTPAYAEIPLQLATDGTGVPSIAEQVLGIAAGLSQGGHRLRVTVGPGAAREISPHDATPAISPGPRDAYDVLIAKGLLAETGARIASAGLGRGRCAVISNPTVAGHHAPRLLDSLCAAGYDPFVIELPDGEIYKTLATAGTVYARLAEARLARNEAIIALGGGVTGDLAGFVAATWLRGVPFVQIPTSLLSMVDASVGGKAGVDMHEGKNLIGAFKQPELVLIDPQLLTTLAPVEYRSGLAEMIKAGIIADAGLFERLGTGTPEHMTPAIADAVRVKADLVMRDPYEAGDRAWLNLGHTFGHALEVVSNYSLRHGEAVALGLVAAAELSVSLGLCPADIPARVRASVAGAGLPKRYAFDPNGVMDAMATDKKRVGRTLRFVVIERIGRVRLMDGVSEGHVRVALEAIRE
jgi:shikimate kinase / 3-dehydroquinate synthase